MFRYHALRMKQLSDAFREVYADQPDAIGDRARVFCFGQYTAGHMNTMLQFLDDYFNKADPKSTYTGQPHPPSYYLWGGGGALYYGCSNKFGLMDAEADAERRLRGNRHPQRQRAGPPDGHRLDVHGPFGRLRRPPADAAGRRRADPPRRARCALWTRSSGSA